MVKPCIDISPPAAAVPRAGAPTPPALMQALGHSLSDRRLQVLSALQACGSISQAAREVGVSYKAAWQAIDTLGNLAGVPVVQKSVGGAGGGGAKLTDAGLQLLRAAQAMEHARGAVLQQLQVQTPTSEPTTLQRLGLQTSMRNQWPCVVQQVTMAGALAQVQVQAASASGPAMVLTASITAESAQLLGLVPGLALLALCKATAVQVLPWADTASAPASNAWPAKATRVHAGALGDEVAAQTAGGLQLVGFAPPHSALRAGRKVRVHVPAASVVLALV